MSQVNSPGPFTINPLELRLEMIRREQPKVLIVGGRASNFSQKVLEHPQLIFWHSTDPKSVKKRQIPTTVGLVMMTRFIDHTTFDWISQEAGKHEVMVLIACGTGEIKTRLMEMGYIASAEKLPECLNELANFEAPDEQAEIERLIPLLRKSDIMVGRSKVLQCFRSMRASRSTQEHDESAADVEVMPTVSLPKVLVPQQALPPCSPVIPNPELLTEEEQQIIGDAKRDLITACISAEQKLRQLPRKHAVTVFLRTLKYISTTVGQ